MKNKFKSLINYMKNNLVIVIPVLFVIVVLVFTIISIVIANNKSNEGYDSYDEGMLDQIHEEFVKGDNFALSNREYLTDNILDRNSLIVYNNLSDFILTPEEIKTADKKNTPEEGMPDGYFTGTIENVFENKELKLKNIPAQYDFDLNITDDRIYNVKVLLSNLNPMKDSSTDYYGEYYVAVLLKYRSFEDKYVLYINHYEDNYDNEIFDWIDYMNLNKDSIDVRYIDLFEKE